MSTVQGGQGNIVTNGLILNLDAANPRSYPQPYNGTDWQNIAPVSSSLTGSLVNGSNYITSGSGCIMLDGTNDYISLPTVGFGLPSLTIDIWFKRYSTSTYGYLWVMDNYDQPELRLSFGSATGAKLNVQYYDNGAYMVNTTSTTNFSTSLFYNVSTTITNNSQVFYVNGIPEIIRSGSYDGNSGNNLFEQTLGTYNRPGAGYGGYASVQYGAYRVYNRVLSNSEVLQNFNATRARFGV
jgi:hypothetical protein